VREIVPAFFEAHEMLSLSIRRTPWPP